MEAVHKTLLEVNEEFLVAEAPADSLIAALQAKQVLTNLDTKQLRSLEPQGSRAMKRFLLHVLPLRGPVAFPALLEALQEAHAQHLVDLLLEEEAVLLEAVKPIYLPEREKRKPPDDPNDYARRLRANTQLIESAVDPNHLIPSLLQNGVLTELEERVLDELKGRHVLTWSMLWCVLMQRGAKAYGAFMGALLQHGYSALFHTIKETKVTGPDALESALLRHTTMLEPNNNNIHNDKKYLTADNSNVVSMAQTFSPTKPVSTVSTIFTRAALSPRDTGPLATSSPAPKTSSVDLQATVSRSNSEVISEIIPLEEEESSEQVYSLGGRQFQCSPRTEDLIAEEEHQPKMVDLQYSPTWADPFNHVCESNEQKARSMYMSFTAGMPRDKPLSPLDLRYPSKHASIDLNSGDCKKSTTGVPRDKPSSALDLGYSSNQASTNLNSGECKSLTASLPHDKPSSPLDFGCSSKNASRPADVNSGEYKNSTFRMPQDNPSSPSDVGYFSKEASNSGEKDSNKSTEDTMFIDLDQTAASVLDKNSHLENPVNLQEERQMPVFGPMEAIPEQDGESEAGNLGDEERVVLSQPNGKLSGSATYRILTSHKTDIQTYIQTDLST